MQRFKQPNMDLHPDGEWIRYDDHVEAMKRIAAAPPRHMVADSAGGAEPICPACKGSGQIATGCDEFSESICKTCEGVGIAAPAPAQHAEPVAWMVTHPDLKAQPGNETIVQTREAALEYLRGGWAVRPLAHGFAAPAPVASPAALTREDRKRIARDVQVQCSLIPGATFYNAAEMAIDAFKANIETFFPPSASPAKPVYDCSTPDCQCDACCIERGEAGPFNDVEDRAPSASPTRIETLRKALFESRDAMRVMANWVKKSDPAGHSWGVRMVDRANAALNGEPAASPAGQVEIERLRRISWLIGSIFVHGNFVAETFSERELESLLRKQGTFWETLSEFDAAMSASKEGA